MSAFDGLKFDTTRSAPGRVTNAIANASRRTGVDFNYLMSQARVESSLNPNARAATSSASGLYQFIDQSWLKIINDHGAEYGMDWAASAIQKTSTGSYYVADPQIKQQILDLRNHPETASAMAAEFASDNRNYLVQQTGRQPEAVDLYLAHFLGAGGAAKFINTMNNAPGMPAAGLFPAAARANPSIFYDRDGSPRSLADIRASFAQKLNGSSSGGWELPGTGGSSWSLPNGTRMVQPADYMRIAQERLAMGDGGSSNNGFGNPLSMPMSDTDYGNGDTVNDGDTALLNDIQSLTFGRAVNAAKPNIETARLAYLMLATLGR
ncbi:MAG: lytic transglycosylase domain-containing protein [Sphingobium sp.]|nr:lytic transglycosylase domain-containing protein [Sphingobium sp.]